MNARYTVLMDGNNSEAYYNTIEKAIEAAKKISFLYPFEGNRYMVWDNVSQQTVFSCFAFAKII